MYNGCSNNKFVDLIFTIIHSELYSYHFTSEIDVRLKDVDKKKAELEEEERHSRENKKKLQESLDDAEKAFKKTLDEMPTSSDFMKMQVQCQEKVNKLLVCLVHFN